MKVPITDHQATVANAALDHEESKRRHLIIALTGAHAYGFSSPDSDLDLKGVHLSPTKKLVGLTQPAPHASRLEVIEGVEIDYASNEIGQVLAGLVRGFGSYYERILGMWILRRSSETERLQDITRRSLSRRVHAHYRGFSAGMLREASAAETTTAKKLLYVLRTGLTGAHLLATGTLVTELPALIDDYGFSSARELLDIKRTGERTKLEPATAKRWIEEARRVESVLDAARARSPLPEESPNVDEIEAFLIDLRRTYFDT